ncbi:EH domain-containing protein 4 [Cricetulus griseus]|uniref:EH domain-containing protein 4 n=1 Tax=Cricetulus griseus TaxID=10029 RepID=G3H0Y9_CRIGR|nr:EH domain-containing protein 4 [Cricetulus griseus]
MLQPLKQTCEYCTTQNIPFPSYSIQEDDKSLKECYLMENPQEPDTPIVAYFPLINDTFQKYKAPGVERSPEELEQGQLNIYGPKSPYATKELTYTEAAFDKLVKLTEYNILNNKDKLIQARKVLPLEEAYRFHEFHSPALEDADFENKPMILLVGQYSTGKTTFIRYLLEQDFPGMRIGPEPTTDSFIAVMYGETEGSTPGNALVVDPKKPFRKLSRFGNAFLNRFMCSQLPNQVLKSISIIDSPGILSGEKQRISRGYDFCQVLQWFAERVDRIILLFDAHKLDISDEFSEAIKAFRGQDDKIRVVLNKADQVDTQQLMRVYGALMWSLGKVINTPEVLRVYIGSFWAQPLQNTDNRRLFEAEAQDLFRDIQSLPQKAAVRKLNDLIKRARLAKVHAYIISYLKKEMPNVFGKENKKRELIFRLPEIYVQLQREYQISAGDFPEVKAMQEQLENYDFTKFHSLKPKLIEAVDNMLSNKIASLMSLISQEEMNMPTQMVQGGAFDGTTEGPFNQGYGEGAKEGADEEEWVVAKDKPVYDELFYTLSPINGKISGVNAKKEMVTSKLPNSVLGKIWKLADCDCDGMLDEEEFALAKHLIKIKLDGYELPNSLPPHLVPPSHRKSLPKAD